MTINEFLLSLKPAGDGSFEDLVGELLSALTGLRFYSARSGDQGGRDGRASGTGGDIVFECKRYSAETSLKDRELLGELAQAHMRRPELDVWIIAASRAITDQNLEGLEAFGKEHGIDIVSLESLQDGSANLDFLVGAFPAVAQRYASPNQLADLTAAAEVARRIPEAETRLAELRRTFLQPDAGWAPWRASSHDEWNRLVTEEPAARSRFGQPLAVSSGGGIPRFDAETALNNWWNNDTAKLFAMTGEEGDGKSWSVAQWLTNQLLKKDSAFPPIVFIPSRDAGSAKSLEDLVLENVRRLLPNGDWQSKLHRWLEHRDADGKQPVAVIVLDGLNERHTSDYWQTVIETSFDRPWVGKVRLICTARSQYWDEFFAKRKSIPATSFRLKSFSDGELQLALNGRGLKVSDFPEELRPLLRKPRYFDLAAQYRDQVAESGDFTLARLYFEDWRDRCDRNNPGLSEDAFNDVLKQIAERHRDGVQRLAKSEVEQYIGFDSVSRSAFTELTTSGVLEKEGSRWRVSSGRLPMALGLLLGDELAIAQAGADFKELIAKWLEPHTGSDMEALIIEYAVLASVAQGVPSGIVANLLQAWIDTQNPRSPIGSPIERRLTAYMPQCLEAYVELARSVWSSAKEHPWAQEVLIRGFSFWVQNSKSVADDLVPTLAEWLSMVALDGPPMFRRMPFVGPAPKPDSRVRTLWPDVEPNREYDFDGYLLRIIDDDDWLRLSHAAFVIISFMTDRRPLVEAIVRYGIAKSIHESADGEKELRWAIRSSKFDLEPIFQPHIQRLLADKRRLAQWACSRLLRMLGTQTAWKMLETVDEESLYPDSDFEVESRANPVESIFQCTTTDLEEYANRQDFKPWCFVDSARTSAADTNLRLPQGVAARLDPILQMVDAKPVWQGQWKSGEDHFLEKAEIVMSRVDPGAIANTIRRIVKTAPSRSVEALYSLAFRLEEYDLILDDDTRDTLEVARQNNLKTEGPADSKGIHSEFFLFSRVLPLWIGNGQLERLLARSPEANDWIDFEHSYKGPVEGNLPQATTPKDWFRTLYYLGTLRENKLNDDALRSAYDTGDSLVRGSLYRYLLFCDVPNEKCTPYVADWIWNYEMHHMEQTFGSLLLIKLAYEQKTIAPWQRVDPTFRATALLRVEGAKSDWSEYAAWFVGMIAVLQVPLPEDDVPAYEITYSPQETGRPGRVALAPEPARSVSFVAPESHWGGRNPEGDPFAGLREEPEAIRERTKTKIEQLRELNARAAKLGNFWMERCFPLDAIEAMFNHAPAVIDGSLRMLLNQETPRIPFTAVSYYTALAEVLFSKDERIDDALGLLKILRSMGYGVRIIDGDTRLTHLDIDAFGTRGTPAARTFWEEELGACSSDLDLLELAMKVRRSSVRASAAWLNEVITRDLRSGSAFEQARAVIIRGFLDTAPEDQWMEEPTKDDDSWYRSVLRIAQRRAKSERDARYWFKNFCMGTDRDESWADFRLFLTIADRRCWLWCLDELAVLEEADPRRRFFRSNRDEIRKACKENEEKLPKSFVGCEVADQMSPWRS